MFVSSYNTYIATNTSDKSSRLNREALKEEKESFSSKLLNTSISDNFEIRTLPISYVSINKIFANQQKLNEQLNNQKEAKNTKVLKKLTSSFSKQNSLQNATTAYQDNTKLFSFLRMPHPALNQQVKQQESSKPSKLEELQTKTLRHKMVNTYLQNDKYYQITA